MHRFRCNLYIGVFLILRDILLTSFSPKSLKLSVRSWKNQILQEHKALTTWGTVTPIVPMIKHCGHRHFMVRIN